MKRTLEQDKIITTLKDSKSNVIEARAGSGKTTLGAEAAKEYSRKRWQFIVFNKKNAEEFAQKLPSNAIGATAHSFCNKFIKGRPQLDKSGSKLFKLIFPRDGYNWKEETLSKEESLQAKENFNAMKDLVGLMKNSFIDPTANDVLSLIDHYGIQFSIPLDQACEESIEILKQSDDNEKEIDFNDMVRFPIIRKSIHPSFDYFFLDEAQDNTPIRNELLRQMYEKGCQVIAVGDEFQAIYGFAGASSDSMNQIKAAVNPVVMPLTINFRCGKKIIERAQSIVPDIQAFDGAIDGEVFEGMTNELFEQRFQYGDVALSRFNKVIIPVCFRLIKSGKKATIQGRDFGTMLKNMVRDFKATTIEEFYAQIDRWQERQLKFAKSESATDAVNDRYECMKFFADNSDTVEDIVKRIDAIFSDEQGEGYKLSTCHKAKGLEFKNVFILDSSNFMKTHPTMKAWEIQQLRNLYYVAMTRAKKQLSFVL